MPEALCLCVTVISADAVSSTESTMWFMFALDLY